MSKTDRHPSTACQPWLWLALLLVCLASVYMAPIAQAQTVTPDPALPSTALPATPADAPANSGILLEKDNLRLGINQRIRPGSWMPVQVSLNNTLARPVQVRLELAVPDADRDTTIYTRIITLTPQRSGQRAWVYAVAPADTSERSDWRLQVIEEETNRLLDYQDILVGERLLLAQTTVVGIVGQSMMGMELYASDATQNEAIHFMRGLDPANLPDRWLGLSLFSALIWTPQVNPASAQVPAEFARALRQWVARGGHLVIILPTVGNTWPDSAMADLLPVAREKTLDDVLPLFLGTIRTLPGDDQTISMRVFEPDPAATVPFTPVHLYNDQPWAIAHPVGRGRVTTLGVDLTNPRLIQMGLPSGGRTTLWTDIMGWRGPALAQTYIQSQIDTNKMNRPDQRIPVNPGQFIPGQIAMQDTAAPRLMLAVALFVVYWVVAGPTQFVLLRQRKMLHHAWLGFVAIVLVFTAVSWGGALVLRPTTTEIRHFSILTQTRGQLSAHIHSWLSLYVPAHGLVSTELGQADDSPTASPSTNAIWSTGFGGQTEQGSFSTTRTYPFPLAQTNQIDFAFRSTAKQLELDYLGDLSTPANERDSDSTPNWQPAQGPLQLVDGWPVGVLTHQLPAALEHVSVIYYDGRTLPNDQLSDPYYWLYLDPWQPGQPLNFNGKPANVDKLIAGAAPQWSGRLADLARRFNNSVDGERVELLTFFSMLPPPDYLDTTYTTDIRSYQRTVGRELDLTPLVRMRGLIIIGHMPNGPLPAPLLVEGQLPASRGSTVVRWIYPLP